MTDQVADGRRTTLAAVAHAAGVSVPTVSRVLNGGPGVAVATRRRVETMLRRYGYQRRGSPGLVATVFDDLSCPWAVELLRGVESVTSAAGAGMLVASAAHAVAACHRWATGPSPAPVHAIIAVNVDLPPPTRAEMRRLGIALVVVDPARDTVTGVPTIGATNWAGGLSAAEHLIALGHRRIACVTGPPDVLCSRARLAGFRAGLEAAGIAPDPALVRDGDFGHRSGYAAAADLLGGGTRPTAVFAASDAMAFGVCEAARRRGLRVPDDLSVVGFDDIPEARVGAPPLTTVRQPLAEMGALAARTALAPQGPAGLPASGVELATTLVCRASTARI